MTSNGFIIKKRQRSEKKKSDKRGGRKNVMKKAVPIERRGERSNWRRGYSMNHRSSGRFWGKETHDMCRFRWEEIGWQPRKNWKISYSPHKRGRSSRKFLEKFGERKRSNRNRTANKVTELPQLEKIAHNGKTTIRS